MLLEACTVSTWMRPLALLTCQRKWMLSYGMGSKCGYTENPGEDEHDEVHFHTFTDNLGEPGPSMSRLMTVWQQMKQQQRR